MTQRPRNALPLILLAIALGAGAGAGITFFTGGSGLDPVLSVALIACALVAAVASTLVERRRRNAAPGTPVVWPVLRAVLATAGALGLGLAALAVVINACHRTRVVMVGPTGEVTSGPPDPCAPLAFWDHLAVKRVEAAFPGYEVALAQRCQPKTYGSSVRQIWVRVGRFDVPEGDTALVVDEVVNVTGRRSAPKVAIGPYRTVAEALAGARLIDRGTPYPKAGTYQVCFLGYNDETVPWNVDTDSADTFVPSEGQPSDGWFSVACRPAAAVARDQWLLLAHPYVFDAYLKRTTARFKLWVPHDDPMPPGSEPEGRGTEHRTLKTFESGATL